LKKKISYQPLEKQSEKIWNLVKQERYRNPDAVIDTALNILLAWESDRPEDTMKIMQTMMPFTQEQEKFMKVTMKEDQRDKHFGKAEIESAKEEAEMQKLLAISDYDHLRIQNNLELAREFVSQMDIARPKNVIEYDGYPLLFHFYSRFFPVKVVICVLANMLYEKNRAAVRFSDLRTASYDIAEEISGRLVEAERAKDVPRNKKISTGLPKKGRDGEDIEKIAHSQKRFKDQYVGKIRRERATKKAYVEGAPSALGLICVFEEDGTEHVTLTESGRRFYLMSNPIIKGDYMENALTKEECGYILEELVPRLRLENIFVDAAVRTIRKAGAAKITDELDMEFLKAFRKFSSANRSDSKRFGFDATLASDEMARSRITAYRVATMGRLAELRVVEWEINKKGESEFAVV